MRLIKKAEPAGAVKLVEFRANAFLPEQLIADKPQHLAGSHSDGLQNVPLKCARADCAVPGHVVHRNPAFAGGGIRERVQSNGIQLLAGKK